ncbi:Internalin-A_(fragment) [Hexamita inflata]|uniref:Internalin-A n=1 Tax=Hexamita inflata TaxID=28002 RepID=A0AA86QGB8_9EUKA
MNTRESQEFSNTELQHQQYEKHLPSINNRILKIQNETLNDLSFVQKYQLSQLYISDCQNISFQHAFSDACSFLQVKNCNVQNLDGIEQNKQLQTLYLYDNLIEDISPLRNLKFLTTLAINNNKTSDISLLNLLQNLKYLYANSNNIVDLSKIEELHFLETLYVSNNKIISLYGLQNLKYLKELYADRNQITYLYGIQHLKNLQMLKLIVNEISDISPVSGCSSLKCLLINDNQITDVSPLYLNRNLNYIDISYNFVDSEGFVDLKKLNNIETMHTLKNKKASTLQIRLSSRMRFIFQTKCQLENMKLKRILISNQFSSTQNKSKLQLKTLINGQIILSNKLLLVFGTPEQASQ